MQPQQNNNTKHKRHIIYSDSEELQEFQELQLNFD